MAFARATRRVLEPVAGLKTSLKRLEVAVVCCPAMKCPTSVLVVKACAAIFVSPTLIIKEAILSLLTIKVVI